MQDTKIIFGTAAFIRNKIKGQEYVIRALAILKAKGITNIEYRLAGSGSPEKLVRLAESLGVSGQLKVYGALPHEEVFSWYDDLDVYIQPSFHETLGRSVVEAMSRGLPAACSRIGGMVEYASKDIMFGAGNVNEISVVMEKLMNPEVREREAVKSFRIAHEFSKDILDRRRGEFYSEFTGVKNW
ncbi:MAG: glycosyltransferase family 4 protein [Synergistaceae bacterium]|nr:glycosyltransferase family 4 protein [Synergistaceae bacterium]